jgi:hypothetical protein
VELFRDPPEVPKGGFDVSDLLSVGFLVADLVFVSVFRTADEVNTSMEDDSDELVEDVVDDLVGLGVATDESLDGAGAGSPASLLPHAVARHCCCAERSFELATMQLLCHWLHINEGTVFV